MNNNLKKLVSHLEQEINWIEQLNNLLAEEKIMLATRQFGQLEGLAEKKQTLSTNIEESAKERMDLINNFNKNIDPALSLKEFLKDCTTEESKQIDKLNTKLVGKLTMCRELNTVNGQVIANNIHTRQQIVNALSGNRTDAVSVYNANGNIKSAADNNHHQEA
jgi:flagella synthesis protein FlgN